jgi:Na+-driven multidrug efflux pump
MSAVTQALQVMGIGLPVMFLVIVLFMILTTALIKIFPYKPEEEESAEG